MKKTKLRRFSKAEVPKLKRKLWLLLSTAIRERDKWTCITCGKKEKGAQMHAGHFIQDFGHQATAWDPTNIHAQCARCNLFLHGNLIEYYPAMIKRYGRGHVESLKVISKSTRQWTAKELQVLIEAIKRGGLEEYSNTYY